MTFSSASLERQRLPLLSKRSLHADAVLCDTITYADRLEDLQQVWEAFEQRSYSSGYQRYGWVKAWWEEVGNRSGAKPLIALVHALDGGLVAILPFQRRTVGPCTVLSWLADEHSNYHMGLYSAAQHHAFSGSWAKEIVSTIAKDQAIDLISLRNQPLSWMDFENPFAELPRFGSVDPAFAGTLLQPFTELYSQRRHSKARSRLRNKERKLRDGAVVESRRITDPNEAHAALDEYFLHKAKRLQSRGLANPFESSHVQRFLHRALDARDLDGNPNLMLDVLIKDGRMLALYGGVQANRRYSLSIAGITEGDDTRYSPGEILLRDMLGRLTEQGAEGYDFGVGDARYKREWSDIDPLFDTIYPLTSLGWVAAVVIRAIGALKKQIKRSDRIVRLLQPVKAKLFR